LRFKSNFSFDTNSFKDVIIFLLEIEVILCFGSAAKKGTVKAPDKMGYGKIYHRFLILATGWDQWMWGT
jgi:hypothetical protein